MRRSLGILLLLAALAACGDDDSAPTITDGPPSSPSSPSESATVAPAPPLLLSGSDGGGRVDPAATPLPDETATTAFVAGLDDGLAGQVIEAAAGFDVPVGQELYGAVVAIGCTPPEAVTLSGSADAVRITAEKLEKDPQVQCLVPVTTVALALVDQGAE